MPRRLSILRPVSLLLIWALFMGLYLDRAMEFNRAPRQRFRPHPSFMIGIEFGIVAGNGPYGSMGIYRPSPDSRNLLFYRGIGYALRIDRIANADGSFSHHWFIRIPHWFFAAIFAGLSIFSLRRHLKLQRQWERAARGLCPECGYDLRATPGRCPECGCLTTPVDAAYERLSLNESEERA